MIIQKLASAIRRQDWFQVVIEVLIVIVGIYLGLQVTDWTNEREERFQERAFLERLHNDVIPMQSSLSNYKEAYDFFFNKTKEAADILTTDKDYRALTEEHCRGIEISHIYTYVTTQLPSVTELISSGQFSLIKNQDLRIALGKYTMSMDEDEMLNRGFINDRLDLARKYPDLLTHSFGKSEGFVFEFNNVTCDFLAMQNNPFFKNDLLGNLRRMYYMSNNQFSKEPLLQEIHDHLDASLDINH